MNSCSYYDVSNESYARFNALIETMNEQHRYFISEMRECDLLHETNPSLPSLRPKAGIYDDWDSSLHL